MKYGLSTWSPQNHYLGLYFDGKKWQVAGELTPNMEQASDDLEPHLAEGCLTLLHSVVLNLPPKTKRK
jgi:hypothetical protein